MSGLVPCNVIADEILTDHPARYRAMIVEAANPAHSVADSPRFREALRALDTLVVIDVAMTETARLADYVLPAATQFEKAEATFFNFEFPRNSFHLRPRLLAAAGGAAPRGRDPRAALPRARRRDRGGPGAAPRRRLGGDGRLRAGGGRADARRPAARRAGAGAPLPDAGPSARSSARARSSSALALRAAMQSPASLARAGFGGSPIEAAQALFDAILANPSGVVFSVDGWEEVIGRIATPDGRIHLALPDLLAELGRLRERTPFGRATPSYPFVLSAGERRSFTANTIIRDPAWRKTDAAGALRMSPEDAAALGVGPGDRVRVTTRRGTAVATVEVSDTLQRGHVTLPNGLGLTGAAGSETPGVAPNELTSSGDRDPFVGTPWHKHVPARVERV